MLQSTGARVQVLSSGCTGWVAPRHVGSSQTRDRTRVPCNGWWIPIHCTTREVLDSSVLLSATGPLNSRVPWAVFSSPSSCLYCRQLTISSSRSKPLLSANPWSHFANWCLPLDVSHLPCPDGLKTTFLPTRPRVEASVSTDHTAACQLPSTQQNRGSDPSFPLLPPPCRIYHQVLLLLTSGQLLNLSSFPHPSPVL